MSLMHGSSFAGVHNRAAFFTVVCLGLIQITTTYLGSHLAIESLPSHVPERRRKAFKAFVSALLVLFVSFTLLLAKLNDASQYRADLIAQQERAKQEDLRGQLQQTLRTVTESQEQLQHLRSVVETHPLGEERSAMIDSINQIQVSLQTQEHSMRSATQR